MRKVAVERAAARLRLLLHTDDTPARAALAFAIGVFIGWTPAIGFHVLLALGLAILFGLNRVAMVAGTFVNNPWTIVPMYSASAWFGSILTGAQADAPRLHRLSTWTDFGELYAQLQPWIVPLTTGTLVLGLGCALVSFPIMLYGIRWYRAVRRAH